MSKYEKKGTITFSPTAITDKEEVHEIHRRTEEGGNGINVIIFDYKDGVVTVNNKKYECTMGYNDDVEAITAKGLYEVLFDIVINCKPYFLTMVYDNNRYTEKMGYDGNEDILYFISTMQYIILKPLTN